MHVENGRKRVERVAWPGRACRYGWKRIAGPRRGEGMKEERNTRSEHWNFSFFLLFFFLLWERNISKEETAKEEKRRREAERGRRRRNGRGVERAEWEWEREEGRAIHVRGLQIYTSSPDLLAASLTTTDRTHPFPSPEKGGVVREWLPIAEFMTPSYGSLHLQVTRRSSIQILDTVGQSLIRPEYIQASFRTCTVS